MALSRNHQTALFVRSNPSDSAAVRNRAAGLVGSLNRDPNYADGGTIKADVYTVNEVTGEITPGYTPAVAKPVLSASVRALVADAGFNLVPAYTTSVARGRVSSPRLRSLAADAGYTATVIFDS